jgi:predicted Zn-dependent protease
MASDGSNETNWAARVEKTFNEARARFQAQTNQDEAAWQFGRACFDLADLATNKVQRADLAKQGIDVCRQLTARQPKSAPGHYYLGMNLGQLADTKRNLAALKMVKEMEREFQAAADLDDRIDYAGPERNLGLLYLQSPVIVSIGSRAKAQQHLRRAVELAPEYPENRLNLIEAGLKWGDRAGARRELKALEEHWPEAQHRLAGEAWAASWVDWKKRLANAADKLGETSRPMESPHSGD